MSSSLSPVSILRACRRLHVKFSPVPAQDFDRSAFRSTKNTAHNRTCFDLFWLENPSNINYLNHRIHYQTTFDKNQSALSQTMCTVCQPITACSLGTQQDAGTRLATALRRRPFSACNKGNRRRLHAGKSLSR